MSEVFNNIKQVEEFLSRQQTKCKQGEIINVIIIEDILEKIPAIASKYNFSVIDGENLENDKILLKLEFRQLFS
ncbi:MAG: hypothetical protein QXH75_07935 [Sulfolobaceae archaeon]|jgi:hypothetical protein